MSESIKDRNAYNAHKPVIKLKNELGEEVTYYSVMYDGLPEEFKQMARKELGETEEKLREGLLKLKQVQKEENIRPIDDATLIAILRHQRYDIKKSIAKMKKGCAKREELLQTLKKVDMETVEAVIDDLGFGFFPYRDQHGRAIGYMRPCFIDPDRYSMQEFGAVVMATGLFLFTFPLTSVTGFTYFGEVKSPSLTRNIIICKALKDIIPSLLASPLRVPRIEVFNENYIIRWFVTAIKPILNKKVVERIFFHGYTYDTLKDFYDPKILPEEFGGSMGPLKNIAYRQKLLSFIKNLKEEES